MIKGSPAESRVSDIGAPGLGETGLGETGLGETGLGETGRIVCLAK